MDFNRHSKCGQGYHVFHINSTIPFNFDDRQSRLPPETMMAKTIFRVVTCNRLENRDPRVFGLSKLAFKHTSLFFISPTYFCKTTLDVK